MTTKLPISTLDDVLVLPSVSLDETKLLPERPGLYFVVLDGDAICYVGMTNKSLRSRWLSHHIACRLNGTVGTRLHYLETADGVPLVDLERQAIAVFNPPHNGKVASSGRASDLDGRVLVEEAAAELGVSKWAILKAIEKGQIERMDRIGSMHAIPIEAWEKYKRDRRPRGRPRGSTRQPR